MDQKTCLKTNNHFAKCALLNSIQCHVQCIKLAAKYLYYVCFVQLVFIFNP